MREVFVKTSDCTYKFDNPKDIDTTPDNILLAILTDRDEKVYFPLCNVIYFSIEEVSDEND